MYKFFVKRISDGVITHGPIFKEDPNFQPKIPKGWNLENNHVVIKEDYIVPYTDLRRADYRKEIDPFAVEALLENCQGRPEKLQVLLQKREEIRKKYPKPDSVSDPIEGEEEWL